MLVKFIKKKKTNNTQSHANEIAPVNERENKVMMSLSPQFPWLSPLIPASSCMMVKNEAPYAASCSFLIEVSDFSRLHTCVKQMIMLLESFTVTLLRWIWAALSHHANVATQKNLFSSSLSLLSGENYFCNITKKDYALLSDPTLYLGM